MVQQIMMHLHHGISGSHLKNELDLGQKCLLYHPFCYGFYCFYSFTDILVGFQEGKEINVSGRFSV